MRKALTRQELGYTLHGPPDWAGPLQPLGVQELAAWGSVRGSGGLLRRARRGDAPPI